MRFASVQQLRVIYRIVLSGGWVSHCITLYWWNPRRDRVISLTGQPSAACPGHPATSFYAEQFFIQSSGSGSNWKGWHTDSRVVLRAVNEPSQIFTVCFGRFVQLRSLKLPVFWSLWTSIPILCLLTVSRCQHNVLIDSYLNCESTSKRSQQGEGLLPTCTVKSSWIFVDSSIGAVWLWRDPVKPRGLMTRPALANIG